MIIRKVGAIKPNMVIQHKESKGVYTSFWDRLHNCVCATNGEKVIPKPTSSYFDIIGELSEMKKVGEDFILSDTPIIKVDDCYELIKKDKVVDVLLVTFIDSSGYHILHKNGRTEVLSKEQAFLLLNPGHKKYLGTHYQIIRK